MRGHGGYTYVPTARTLYRGLEYTSFTPLQEFFGGKAPGIGARFRIGPLEARQSDRNSSLRSSATGCFHSAIRNDSLAYQVTPVAYPCLLDRVDAAACRQRVEPDAAQPKDDQGRNHGARSSFRRAQPGSITGPESRILADTTALVAAPLDQEPVFIKAGAIIPMGPVQHYVGEHPADPLTLDIYPAGSTSYTLYEDDGISEGYLGGAYSMTRFSSDDTGGQLVVGIGAQATAKHAYTGQLCSRTYVLKINGQGAAPAAVTRDGKAEPMSSGAALDAGTQAEGWYYDSVAQTVWVWFSLSSTASTSVSL